jgi:hypothetical protein
MLKDNSNHQTLIPGPARRLAKLEGTTSLDDLERYRSELGQAAEMAKRSGQTGRAANADYLRKEIDKAIGAWEPPPMAPPDVASSLKQARRATLLYYRQFDPALSSIRGSTGGRAAQGLVTAGVVDAGNVAEARRAVQGTLGNPAEAANLVGIARNHGQSAVDGVRASYVDLMLGGVVDTRPGQKTLDFSAKAAYTRFRQDPKTARVYLGNDGYKNAMTLLDRARKLELTVTGTPGAASRAGSTTVLHVFMNAMSGGVTGAKMLLRNPAANWLSAKLTGQGAANRIFKEALLDPQLARDILANPSAHELAAWQARMSGALVRSGIRTGATELTEESE